MPAKPVTIEIGAVINRAVGRLQRQLRRDGRKASRGDLRRLVADFVVKSAMGPASDIASLLDREFLPRELVKEAEALAKASLAEGRSKGGATSSQVRRGRAEAWAREWLRRADQMNPDLSLRAKARVIADEYHDSHRTVYDTLRKHRPRKRT